MVCYHKNWAIISKSPNPQTGKKFVKVLSSVRKNTRDEVIAFLNLQYPNFDWNNLDLIKLPCGKCIGCRIESSRQWAVRNMHEAKMYEDEGKGCAFVTLTYGKEATYNYLKEQNPNWSNRKLKAETAKREWTLIRKDFQLFMKRLRKEVNEVFPGTRLRFFHCGEYGSLNNRPHHHVLIYGYNFRAKNDRYMSEYKRLKGKGYEYWRSKIIEKCWKFGFSYLAGVSYESAAYVSRYCTKKITGKLSKDYYQGREPEYVTMSNRRGIGSTWCDKYALTDVYNDDSVTVDKRFKLRPPKYYDKLFDEVHPDEFARIREKREEIAIKNQDDSDYEDSEIRACEREHVLALKVSRLTRSIGNEYYGSDEELMKKEFMAKAVSFGIDEELARHVVDDFYDYSYLPLNVDTAYKIAMDYLSGLDKDVEYYEDERS